MKKSLPMVLLGLVSLFTSGVKAQTDVTSTYLTNTDFESATAIDKNVCTYAKDVSANNTTYSSLQPVTGWTASTSADASAGAAFAYGGTPFLGGTTYVAPSVDNAGNTGKALGVVNVWSAEGYYSEAVTDLPAGVYALTVYVYNSIGGTNAITSRIGFVPSSGTATYGSTTKFTVGQWTKETVSFTLTSKTSGNITIGYKASNAGSSANPHLFFDNVTLSYTAPNAVLVAEISKANTLLATLDVTSNDYTYLNSAITAAQAVADNQSSTVEEYTSAVTTLQIAEKSASLGFGAASLTSPVKTDLVVNGTFDTNTSGWTSTTNASNQGTASNQTGAFTGKFWENWNANSYIGKMYQTVSNVPNGTYKLDICAFVNTLGTAGTQFVYANDSTTNLTATAPTAYSVVAYVSNNSIEFGLKQTVATANWLGIDNVSLTYYSKDNIVDKVKAYAYYESWKNALKSATGARDSSLYAAITGIERTNLVDTITAYTTEPATIAAYTKAATSLNSAINAFTAAQSSYDAFESAKNTVAASTTTAYPYASAAKFAAMNDSLTIATAIAPVSAADATVKTTSIIKGVRLLIESNANAEGVEGAKNYTDSIINHIDPIGVTGWSQTGNTGSASISTQNNESYTDGAGSSAHSYFDGGNWGGTAWTVNFNQALKALPSGKYLLSVIGRASTSMTSMKLFADTISVDMPFVGNTGGTFDRGWNRSYLLFTKTADVDTISIGVKAETSLQYQWMSFGDFKLYFIGKEVLSAAIDDAKAMLDTIADSEKAHLQAAIDSAITVKNIKNVTAEQKAAAIYMLKIAKTFALQGFSSATLRNPITSTFVINGTFSDNINGWTTTTKPQNSGTATNQTGAFTGKFWENWNPSSFTGKLYQTTADVPNGTYKLSICAFANTLGVAGTQFVYANDSTTNLTSTTPTAYSVVAYVSNDTIEFGLNQNAAVANWVGIDNISLSYYSPENIVAKVNSLAYYEAWRTALTAATTARDGSDYVSVTGIERTNLLDSIAAYTTEPTSNDAYTAAAASLTSATTAFTSAKSSYDALVAAKTSAATYTKDAYPYASDAKYTAMNDAVTAGAAVTSASEASTKSIAIYKAIRQFVESNNVAEGFASASNYTTLITNATEPSASTGWDQTGNTGSASIGTRNNESYTDGNGSSSHSYFDGGNWSGTAWSIDFNQTLTTLPEGKYILSVYGRAATAMTSFKLYADTVSVDVPCIGNTGGVFDRGWNNSFLVFEQAVANTPVKIGISAATSSQYQWMSFNDFKLYRVSLTPVSIDGVNVDSKVPMNIYNLNGQRVRTNATSTEGLGKGIYIINGKKSILK
jgi:hypothetical protein